MKLIIAALVVIFATNASAQTQPSGKVLPGFTLVGKAQHPEDSEYRKEMTRRWSKRHEKWEAWALDWYNVFSFGSAQTNHQLLWWQFPIRPRQIFYEPSPPVWLYDDCIEVINEDEVFRRGCQHLRQWQDGLVAKKIRREIEATRLTKDKPTHTNFLQYWHIDLMWMKISTGARARGFIGSHFGIPLGDRVQIFAAPGVLLLCLDGAGCKPSYDYGASFRLVDFPIKFLFINQEARLHLNFAKVWTFGPEETGIDLGGFSVTFKKR